MFIFNWIVSTLAIVLTSYLVPGAEISFVSALLAALVLGVLNAFIRPLILLLTLPLNILTLGLLTFIINGVIILLVAAIVPGFHIVGLWTAVLFSIILAVINMLFHAVTAKA